MRQVALSRFTVVEPTSQEAIARLGDTDLEVTDVDDGGRVITACDERALAAASLDNFPDALVLQVHSEDGFGTFLFHEVAIYTDSGKFIGEYICWRKGEIHPTHAREETPESRGMPRLFLNTERGFGGKPPKNRGFGGIL